MTKPQKYLLLFASLLGLFAVITGAFGAHALKESLSIYNQNIFETAVRYQFYHIFAIFFSVYLPISSSHKGSLLSGYLFLMGIILFSGSLYLLVLTNMKFFGIITPIGGLFFILGWINLCYIQFKRICQH